MRGRTWCVGLGIVAGLTADLRAQVPSVPSSPIAATPAVSSVPTTGGGQTLCGFLGLTPAKFAACRSALCGSQFGQLLNNGTKPLGCISGGIVPSLCPPSSAFGPATGDPTGPQSVASAIQKDEANAKARVAAVEYLGTVDCHYWPDAAVALANSLRTDRNECVRFAAARVLGTGCCCTKKTIDALTLTVSSSDADGNPSETSERVKAAAFFALQHCLTRFNGVLTPTPGPRPEEPIRPELPASARPGEGDGVQRAAYYDRQLEVKPMTRVIADARLAVAQARSSRVGSGMVTGRRSVSQALAAAIADPNVPDESPRVETIRPVSDVSAPRSVTQPQRTAAPPTNQRDLFHIMKSSFGRRDVP